MTPAQFKGNPNARGHISFGMASTGQVTPESRKLGNVRTAHASVAFKLSLVPAHLWTPDVYEGATSPVVAFLATASMGGAIVFLLLLLSVAGVIGGAIAAPNRVAVCLTGDAAFTMHGFEVHVAAELGVRAIWVVLDNAGHGMIQQGERLAFGQDLGYYAFEHRVDAAAIARGLGAAGVDVDCVGALQAAIREAIKRQGPTGINARIDASIVAPTLDRRARAVATC